MTLRALLAPIALTAALFAGGSVARAELAPRQGSIDPVVTAGQGADAFRPLGPAAALAIPSGALGDHSRGRGPTGRSGTPRTADFLPAKGHGLRPILRSADGGPFPDVHAGGSLRALRTAWVTGTPPPNPTGF